MALKAVKCLNNFYINELGASLSVKLCQVDPKVDPEGDLIDRWLTFFEVTIPIIEDYDYKARILGVHEYNFLRIIELCNKEYFHGEIKINFEEEKIIQKNEGILFILNL